MIHTRQAALNSIKHHRQTDVVARVVDLISLLLKQKVYSTIQADHLYSASSEYPKLLVVETASVLAAGQLGHSNANLPLLEVVGEQAIGLESKLGPNDGSFI